MFDASSSSSGVLIDALWHNLGSEVSGLQPGWYYHQLQKHTFRGSKNLKIEMGSHQYTTNIPGHSLMDKLNFI